MRLRRLTAIREGRCAVEGSFRVSMGEAIKVCMFRFLRFQLGFPGVSRLGFGFWVFGFGY